MRRLAAALLLMVLALPARAQVDHVTEYAACLDLLRERPQVAYDSARVWYRAGGGDGAWHCAALAMIQLGEFEKAARALEEIAANGVEVGKSPPGTIYGQAADAWRLAGDPKRAAKVVEEAYKREPENLALQFEWARALVEIDRPKEAMEVLEQARMLRYDPDTLAVKAGALIKIGRPLDALQALNEALAINPKNPWALLERARMQRRGGNPKKARADFETLIQTYPEAPVSATALAALKEVDATGR